MKLPAWLKPQRTHHKEEQFQEKILEHCRTLAKAVENHDVAGTTATVQQMIFRYYGDVRDQSTQSFKSAKRAATFGFVLLSFSIGYVLFMDLMPHVGSSWFVTAQNGLGVGQIGLIAGSIVEAVAGCQFWLYRNAARQFGAFHICLERTHRYLLAYTLASQITTDKDRALERIVCIMANAPMITRQDIDAVESGSVAVSRSTTANPLAP